jgi:hypothetical protein
VAAAVIVVTVEVAAVVEAAAETPSIASMRATDRT